MPITKTEGLIAATFTPMDKNCQLDLSIIPRYVDWLVHNKVMGAFICGTTGEGPSLTTGERIDVAESWVSAAYGRLKIIVHVGHNSLMDASVLAEHAQSIGVDAIGCMPPQFFRPRDISVVADCCALVANAAPDLPFYYYHMPSMSGVDVKVAELLPFLESRIPMLAGIKFTYEDIDDFKACIEYGNRRYDVLFGRDEKLLPAIKAGARGAVGSTYNFAPHIYNQLIESYLQGDLGTAGELQNRAIHMIDICGSGSWHPMAAFKQLMEFAGVECGPTRLPIAAVKPEEKVTLHRLASEFLQSQ